MATVKKAKKHTGSNRKHLELSSDDISHKHGQRLIVTLTAVATRRKVNSKANWQGLVLARVLLPSRGTGHHQ
jgi:hypothetical protein